MVERSRNPDSLVKFPKQSTLISTKLNVRLHFVYVLNLLSKVVERSRNPALIKTFAIQVTTISTSLNVRLHFEYDGVETSYL